jgi:septum site-determining protein MinC
MALVFAPEPPLEDWFRELDEWSKKSPGYFVGRPIILDVAALPLDKEGLAKLIADLGERDILIMGVEGTKASFLGLGMPPLVSAGSRTTDLPEIQPVAAKAESPKATETPEPAERETPAAMPTPPPAVTRAASLVHDKPVRSGQSVIFPDGDITILGSVASGSEVVAGGSIHIYGALRGRAIAGSTGNPAARIFCNKLEAELIAIDGLYRTADEMDPQYRSRPVQAWLEGETMTMAAL